MRNVMKVRHILAFLLILAFVWTLATGSLSMTTMPLPMWLQNLKTRIPFSRGTAS